MPRKEIYHCQRNISLASLFFHSTFPALNKNGSGIGAMARNQLEGKRFVAIARHSSFLFRVRSYLILRSLNKPKRLEQKFTPLPNSSPNSSQPITTFLLPFGNTKSCGVISCQFRSLYNILFIYLLILLIFFKVRSTYLGCEEIFAKIEMWISTTKFQKISFYGLFSKYLPRHFRFWNLKFRSLNCDSWKKICLLFIE